MKCEKETGSVSSSSTATRRVKAFYVYPNPENPEFNHGMDLLCKDWNGFRRYRINRYDQLMEHVKIWNMVPKKSKFLEAFNAECRPKADLLSA